MEKAGMKNRYVCDTCGKGVITVTLDDGTTPFMIRCRATEGCKGMMQSSFYNIPQNLTAQFEWFKPAWLKGYSREMKEYIRKGGLDLREVSLSIAHRGGMNMIGQDLYPDGRVPWDEATPPDIEKEERYWTGRLRSCAYCGSMHPADVAAAIRAGAKGEWADMKYGWPHKSYFEGIPNPHAGLLEVRVSTNFPPEGDRYKDWIKAPDGQHWHEPGRPAAVKTDGKFYSVHLMDATPEDRETIETHLGLHFEFTDDGKVTWRRVIQ